MDSLDLDLVESFELIAYPVLLQWDTVQFRLELKISMLLESIPDERRYCPFVLSHSGDYSLLLLGAYVFKSGRDSIPVLVKTLDLFDRCRVDPVELIP